MFAELDDGSIENSFPGSLGISLALRATRRPTRFTHTEHPNRVIYLHELIMCSFDKAKQADETYEHEPSPSNSTS